MHILAVPSQKAEEMVAYMAELLRKRRENLDASLSALSVTSDLDRAALKRAETCERVPSIGFWIDWADSLGLSLEEITQEARRRAKKKAGEPPERRKLH
jgi:hypothetical protein